jgi:hypothetical protein
MGNEANEMVSQYGVAAIIFVLSIYIFVGALIKHKKWAFMHESSSGILFGAIVAYILQQVSG